MSRLASALAIAVLITACAPRPIPIERTATPGVIVVPTELPNGRIEIALQPSYGLGTVSRIDVSVVVTRGAITGPLEARVMASGIGEGGVPSEVLVRRLAVTPATITAGRRATSTVSWDGRDELGVRVPADAYVLVLEYDANDGGTTQRVRAAATVQMND